MLGATNGTIKFNFNGARCVHFSCRVKTKLWRLSEVSVHGAKTMSSSEVETAFIAGRKNGIAAKNNNGCVA